MTTQTPTRYTLRLTVELEELIETHRAKLALDVPHMIQNADTVTTVYTIRYLIGEALVRMQQHIDDSNIEPPEIKAIKGATTRTIKVQLPRGHIERALENVAQAYELSIHATLRALIAGGARL
jgi:hypothetical protein